MTKLDYIKTLEKNSKGDLWYKLGSNEIDFKTKYFIQDMVYEVNIQEDKKDICPCNGCLIFCKESFSVPSDKNIDWRSMQYVTSNGVPTGEITFGNNIIDTHFEFILSKDDFSSIKEDLPFDENFIPFDIPKEKLEGKVIISDLDYQNCLKCLGYPFVTEDDLEYSREDILNLAIKPSLEEYFHWLPTVRIAEEPVTGSIQKIKFPEDAYDVLGVSVQQRGTHGSGNITNPLLRYFDEAAYGSFNYANLTGNYRGRGRAHTVSSPFDNFVSSRAISQATINLNTRVHFEKITELNDQGQPEKYIKVCSNKGGAYNIHWAIKSLNFDDVEYQQRQNVFKYCQAEIMLLFANLRRQAKSDIPGAVDYSTWITEANTMKQEVVNDWKQLVKASGIMRGSL